MDDRNNGLICPGDINCNFSFNKDVYRQSLEGSWADEDGNLNLTIEHDGALIVNIPAIGEEESVDVVMEYTIDKEEKTITIKEDEARLQEAVEHSNGHYTEETLKSAVSPIVTTFDYSVEQDQLILTEREYGDQMIFI